MIKNKDSFNISTNVTIDIIDVKTNKVIKTIKKHNLVTTLGKNLVRDLLGKAAGVTGLNYIALGTDDTATTVSDTVLGTEVYRAVFTDILFDTSKITFKYYLSSTTANSNTLVEAGLFGDDADGTANSGTLFAHVTHTAIVKTSAVAVTYSWEISIS
jgi:hypothetical protein